MRHTIEEQVQAVFTILSDVYGQSPWTMQQISADLEKPETDYFYVYNDKEIVGFLALQQLVGEIEITNIAVKKDCQGQGLGAQLMERLEESELSIFLEVRESNQAARALYQKCGFQEVGTRKNYYHNPIENALVMKREGKLI